MIRLAAPEDAEQLFRLNEEFNGEGENTVENIRRSLAENRREVVVVAEGEGELAGFLCIQLKRSFCYRELKPEMTELFVNEKYRRRGFAGSLMAFGEEYCRERFSACGFELLTGEDNLEAQALYAALGYGRDGEIHLAKAKG